MLCVLALDLGITKRHRGPVTTRTAGLWTALWVVLSVGFGIAIALTHSRTAGLQFFTGYLIEYALSVDNLFVFLLVFRYFRIESELQHKLLFWGVLGAFGMRASLIISGSALVSRFGWLLYVFGAFLLYTALKMFRHPSEEAGAYPGDNAVIRLAQRLLPISKNAPHGHFFTREEGRFRFTSLFLVLLVVESTDLLFAVDSIPAVLGVSKDPFLLYSSNVCAILGLRSLYFLIAALMEKLRFLRIALAAVLAFVGARMLAEPWVEIRIGVSLMVIGGILLLAVLASTLLPERAK